MTVKQTLAKLKSKSDERQRCRSGRTLTMMMRIRHLAMLALVMLAGCASRTSPRNESPSAQAVLSMPRTGFIAVEGGNVWYEVCDPGGSGGGLGTPLLVLHGGPGAPHDYLSNLAALGKDRPVIFYDQLGCGKSDRPDNTALWTRERFVRELAEVRRSLKLQEVFILGQSWGTILAADYVLTQPSGVRGVVFANEALSVPRTVAYMQTLIDALPPEARDTIRRCERDGTTDTPEYRAAVDVFYKRHMCRTDPWPDELTRTFANMGEHVYGYMNGPSEFTITGTIKDVDVTARLGEITIPALFVTGEYDYVPPRGAAEDAARMPPEANARTVVIAGAGHISNFDQPEVFMQTVGDWLREHDDAASAARCK